MAKKSLEIQQQIDAQRAAISQRIQALQKRVGDDIQATKSGVKDKVASPFVNMKGALEGHVQAHPMMSMAAGFATGVAIGSATDMKHGWLFAGERDGDNFLGGALSSIVFPFVQTLAREAKPIVNEVVGGLKSDLLDGWKSRRAA
jgi:hypothetical protein